MKKIASLVLSLILVFSTVLCNVAIANTSANVVAPGYQTYGNAYAYLILKGHDAILVSVTKDALLNTYAFTNIRLCAFAELYFAYIATNEGNEAQYIWFFQGTEESISLEGYTPVFFDDYSITLRKGDTYYEVDMEQTASTGKLVVNSID